MSELAFERQLREKIEKAIEARAEQIVDGSAATFDQYRADCGFLRGLREALALMIEVHKAMFGEEKK